MCMKHIYYVMHNNCFGILAGKEWPVFVYFTITVSFLLCHQYSLQREMKQEYRLFSLAIHVGLSTLDKLIKLKIEN